MLFYFQTLRGILQRSLVQQKIVYTWTAQDVVSAEYQFTSHGICIWHRISAIYHYRCFTRRRYRRILMYCVSEIRASSSLNYFGPGLIILRVIPQVVYWNFLKLYQYRFILWRGDELTTHLDRLTDIRTDRVIHRYPHPHKNNPKKHTLCAHYFSSSRYNDDDDVNEHIHILKELHKRMTFFLYFYFPTLSLDGPMEQLACSCTTFTLS